MNITKLTKILHSTIHDLYISLRNIDVSTKLCNSLSHKKQQLRLQGFLLFDISGKNNVQLAGML